MQLRYLTFLLLITTLLTNCAAVIVVAAASGMVVYDKRSFTTIERDLQIFRAAHTGLIKLPIFEHSHINVVSFNQTVLLTGQVSSLALKTHAQRIAQQAGSVKHIYNELTVGNPTSLSARVQDTLITSHIRTAMLGKKGLASGSIRIVTEQNVVYLMGVVSNQQASLATQVARQIPGVSAVVKLFEYKDAVVF